MGQKVCSGGGAGGGLGWSPEVKNRILDPFFLLSHILLGLLSQNLETVTGNSPVDEDWRNIFRILM